MRTTPAMQRFIGHFGALGPRWGIEADTCRAHALLYLAGAPLALVNIAREGQRLPPRALMRLIGLGGRAARFIGRAFPDSQRGTA
jgi:hypothetical protein